MAARGSSGLALLIVAGVGLMLYSRSASSAVTVYDDGTAEIPLPDDGVMDDAGYPDDPWSEPAMPDPNVDPTLALNGLLYAIRSSEHTAADVASGDDYYTFYGEAEFTDLSDHPVLTGEMKGVKLPAAMCIAAGIPSGNCVSTAAGAYQATVPTWKEFRTYDGPRLPDFSIESQDEFARRVLKKIGALDLLMAGDVQGAITRASKRWASLPGSTAQQGGRSMDFVLARYNDYVGSA